MSDARSTKGRAKEFLGLGGYQRRYLDVEDVRDLDEVADPDTTTDESRTTWREWIAENKLFALAASLLSIAVIGFVGWQAFRILPGIVSNPYVQLGAVLVTVFAGGIKFGAGRKESAIENQWRCEFRYNDDTMVVLGTYVDAGHGGGFFIPIKGVSRRGQEPTPYTVADICAEFPSLSTKPGLDPDDPAVIQLHPNYTETRQTEHGNYVSVRLGRLAQARESSVAILRTTIPEFREEDMNELAQEAEKQAKEAQRWQKEAKRWERNHADLLDRMDEPVEERVDDFLERHYKMQLAARGDRRAVQDDEEGDSDLADFVGTGAPAVGAPQPGAGNGHQPDSDVLDDVEDDLESDTDDDT